MSVHALTPPYSLTPSLTLPCPALPHSPSLWPPCSPSSTPSLFPPPHFPPSPLPSLLPHSLSLSLHSFLSNRIFNQKYFKHEVELKQQHVRLLEANCFFILSLTSLSLHPPPSLLYCLLLPSLPSLPPSVRRRKEMEVEMEQHELERSQSAPPDSSSASNLDTSAEQVRFPLLATSRHTPCAPPLVTACTKCPTHVTHVLCATPLLTLDVSRRNSWTACILFLRPLTAVV